MRGTVLLSWLVALLSLQYGSVECASPGANICDLPVVVGPCKARMLRYGHVGGGRCEMFFYGGCGGNENNFETEEGCERACLPTEDICELPAVVGLCKALMPRWASIDGVCQEFIYGGCGGNANNFETKAECEEVCPPTEDICELPAVVGLCKALMPRWASIDGVCQEFIYGGCGGNANNFRSKSECETVCGPH